MADKTSIEWAANADGTAGATWNPIRARDSGSGKVGTFCVHKSDGCKNCYAETFQQRGLPNNGIGLAYTAQNLPRVEFFLDEVMLTAPLRRRKPTTYFLSSMTDVFGDWVHRDEIVSLWTVMALCPHHTFIVVTKRSERMRAVLTDPDLLSYISEASFGYALERTLQRNFDDIRPRALPLQNVWLIGSAENQATADERIPDLLATPAAVRGVSCEPLLGPIDLTGYLYICTHADDAYLACPGNHNEPLPVHDPATTPAEDIATPRLDWVIAGGESGPNARPMHPDWARALRDQCAAAGVPFFFKQWGNWMPWGFVTAHTPFGPKVGAFNGRYEFVRDRAQLTSIDNLECRHVGKKAAGRRLDGRTHDERPSLTQQRASM